MQAALTPCPYLPSCESWCSPHPVFSGDPYIISQLGKVTQTEQLKHQTITSSQSWGLEVQDQGVRRIGLSHALSPWLVDDHLLSLQIILSLCISIAKFPALKGHQ